MGGGKSAPDTSQQEAAARAAEARAAEQEKKAADQEEKANRQLSSTARASYGRRTGRRLLIAPGREDQIGTLGGSQSGGGSNI